MKRLIKSNATGAEQWVTEEVWQSLVGLGNSTNFTVLETRTDETAAEPATETETPAEVSAELEKRGNKAAK